MADQALNSDTTGLRDTSSPKEPDDWPSKVNSRTARSSEVGQIFWGDPWRGLSPYRRRTGQLFGPHDVSERSDTYLYVPMQRRS